MTLPFLESFVAAISATILAFILTFGIGGVALMFLVNEFKIIERLKWRYWDMRRIAETLWNKYTS